jgi:SET domain-containing protein
MTKAELMAELSDNTYVMLKPSSIEGIGVFAIQEIPTGCRDMFSKPALHDQWMTLSMKEVEELPPHARLMVGNYCLFDNKNYFVPGHGFKSVDLSLFLNHSDTPNLQSVHDGEYFEALRDIQAGEELLIDYGTIVDSE